MKFIHTSDIHLNSPFTTRLSHIGANDRRRELISTFRKMTEDAREFGCLAVVIAGDLFDSDKIGIRVLDTVLEIIEDCRGVKFLYLTGNHEKNAISASGRKLPENLLLFGDKWTRYEIGGAVFTGRSTVYDNMFSELSLEDGKFNVVVLHGETTEYKTSGGKIGIKDMEALPIDYVALGHYHTFSKRSLGEDGVLVYSGCLEGRGFDEEGDKGYVICDTDSLTERVKFVKRAFRTIHIVNVDLTDALREIDIENMVSSKIAMIPRGDLVRVVLTGDHIPTLRRDTYALVDRFSDLFYHFEVRDESRLKISGDDYMYDKSLKGEFIRTVLSKADLSEEEKSDVIECGLRALAKEEWT